MGKHCPKCQMWLPDTAESCPVCGGPVERKRSRMEIILYGVVGAALFILILGLAMPVQLFNFIQAIDVEFVEIKNGSEALLSKLDPMNDSFAFGEWRENITGTLIRGINSTVVENVLKHRTWEGEHLRSVDALANFVAANMRYRENRDYVDLDLMISKLSGDDRAQVILLASLFNGSNIRFMIDLVEEEGKDGRGYHYRCLVGTTLPEEKVRQIVIKRIRKKRSGLSGTRAKVWFVQDEEMRWYIIDPTGKDKKKRDSFVDTSWIHVGESEEYYGNRSHYSFELDLG
jgi:hypothetical protein